ncbi:MAG: tyrosine-type recombinase/integrase [Candidatus Aenigmatarchaeota archaeon]
MSLNFRNQVKHQKNFCYKIKKSRFYYENVINQKFYEKIPYVKRSLKLPKVLSKEDVTKMIDAVKNTKHRAILSALYYAGLRLSEARNLRWDDIDFQRDIIHIKKAKGDKELFFT